MRNSSSTYFFICKFFFREKSENLLTFFYREEISQVLMWLPWEILPEVLLPWGTIFWEYFLKSFLFEPLTIENFFILGPGSHHRSSSLDLKGISQWWQFLPMPQCLISLMTGISLNSPPVSSVGNSKCNENCVISNI